MFTTAVHERFWNTFYLLLCCCEKSSLRAFLTNCFQINNTARHPTDHSEETSGPGKLCWKRNTSLTCRLTILTLPSSSGIYCSVIYTVAWNLSVVVRYLFFSLSFPYPTVLIFMVSWINHCPFASSCYERDDSFYCWPQRIWLPDWWNDNKFAQ